MFTQEQRQCECLRMSMQDCQDNLLDFYAFVAYTSDCHGWDDVCIEPAGNQRAAGRPHLELV